MQSNFPENSKIFSDKSLKISGQHKESVKGPKAANLLGSKDVQKALKNENESIDPIKLKQIAEEFSDGHIQKTLQLINKLPVQKVVIPFAIMAKMIGKDAGDEGDSLTLTPNYLEGVLNNDTIQLPTIERVEIPDFSQLQQEPMYAEDSDEEYYYSDIDEYAGYPDTDEELDYPDYNEHFENMGGPGGTPDGLPKEDEYNSFLKETHEEVKKFIPNSINEKHKETLYQHIDLMIDSFDFWGIDRFAMEQCIADFKNLANEINDPLLMNKAELLELRYIQYDMNDERYLLDLLEYNEVSEIEKFVKLRKSLPPEIFEKILIEDNIEVVKAVIPHVDTNVMLTSGTPLFYAEATGDEELVQIIRNSNGKSIPSDKPLPAIHILQKLRDDDVSPIVKNLITSGALLRKDPSELKVLNNFNKVFNGHVFGLKGPVQGHVSKDLSTYEGFRSQIACMKLKEISSNFNKDCMIQNEIEKDKFYTASALNTLGQWIESVDRDISKTLQGPYQIINAINKGEAKIISTGWEKHATSVVLTSNQLIKCNRGDERGEYAIEVYNFPPDKLTPEIIDKLRSQDKDYFLNGVNEELSLTLTNSIQLKDQHVGNCSWANTKAGYYGLLLALASNHPNENIKNDPVGPAKEAYKTFTAYSRYAQIKDYLENDPMASEDLDLLRAIKYKLVNKIEKGNFIGQQKLYFEKAVSAIEQFEISIGITIEISDIEKQFMRDNHIAAKEMLTNIENKEFKLDVVGRLVQNAVWEQQFDMVKKLISENDVDINSPQIAHPILKFFMERCFDEHTYDITEEEIAELIKDFKKEGLDFRERIDYEFISGSLYDGIDDDLKDIYKEALSEN